jgi:hypothetical protein
MQQPPHVIGPHAGPGTHWPCAEQLVPGGQVEQVAPLRPHAKFSCANKGMHEPSWQQPGQDMASHDEVNVQDPFWHVSSGAEHG